MFIVTARLNRRRLAAGAAALVLFCGAAVTLHSLAAGRSVGAAAPSPASPKGIKTAEDRVSYLESYGWQVEAEPIAVEELLIPEEFDETYGEYLALQESQGFDLTEYCGKRVKRYTYVITNYPTGESGVQAGLLIYRNTVVGGDVLSARLNGFIHGLAMPETEAAPSESG